MTEVPFTLPAINPEGLDSALRSALAVQYLGLNSQTNPPGGTVYLANTAQPADITAVQNIIAAHNPATLTPDQQAAQTATADRATIKQQLDTQVAQLKAMNPTDLPTAIAAIKQNSHVLGLILNALRNQWG